ncbi:two-component system, chemotaxis family, response regulator CheY [Marinitoga hydrogenitolerans DSM 16785]|uniref:Two-component system, chemotaxis family, response regulator CheY n=1 Tax=Marinitoga hydrogenitolerans (strain DSM 16785 / JCM 12826 / AT1271) TaxID=1122195 RepID=A0A1M4UJE3_MARH1|nr:response regulator [Marinitoga hydrogenitolerans]SHE56680.1 two-component system, chemotaxis family, response regulator CheY [Marinitoga hydrogenitolerans DSM 16785]
MPKVLIIDDSKMTRSYHASILKSAGYEIYEAEDGAKALDILYREDKIDIILTDLNMPNLDGFSLIKKIRDDEFYKNVPIIIVTTLDKSTDKMKGFEVGANFYIVKPSDPESLIESVKLALGDE